MIIEIYQLHLTRIGPRILLTTSNFITGRVSRVGDGKTLVGLV